MKGADNMLFSELKGLEGIDKLNDCVPYVENILADNKLFDMISKSEMTWIEAATPIYKAHPDDIAAIMEILEEKPEKAVDIISTTAKIMIEIFKDEEVRSFFMYSCRSMISTISAMANTKEEPSKAS